MIIRMKYFFAKVLLLLFLFIGQLSAYGDDDQCQKLAIKNTGWAIGSTISKLPLEQLIVSCNISNAIGFLAYTPAQSSYAGFNSTLSNIDVSLTSQVRFSRIQFAELFPVSVQSQMWHWQRNLVKSYLSILRTLDQLNPAPGISYFGRSRSPAFPFVYMETLDAIAYRFRTVPFLDDNNIRLEDQLDRSYAIGVEMTLY